MSGIGQGRSREERIHLAVGPGALTRVLCMLAVVPVLAAALLLVAAIPMVFTAFLDDGAGVGTALAMLLLFVLFLGALYALGVLGYLLLVRARLAMSLAGSVLTERYVVRQRSVDLATATVAVELTQPEEESLVALDPETEARLEVPVRLCDAVLPAGQLIALADAVVAGRVRAGDDDPPFVTAERLYELAGVEPDE